MTDGVETLPMGVCVESWIPPTSRRVVPKFLSNQDRRSDQDTTGFRPRGRSIST